MKKILLILVSLIMMLTLLTSCELIDRLVGGGDDTPTCSHIDADDDYFCDRCGDSYYDGEEPKDEPDKTPDEDKGEQGGTENDDNGKENAHTYIDFSPTEKKLITEILGGLIPFVANDEYYVEEYTIDFDDYYELGISYYTYGNSKAEYEEYRGAFSSYTYEGSEQDTDGDTWHYYTAPDESFYIDISYYCYDGEWVIDLYAYVWIEYEDGSGGGDGGNDGYDNDGDNNDGEYAYTDFTSAEKALFNEYFGEVIPFFINNEYYLEEYTYDYGDGEYEEGLNFYVYGATEAQFTLYRALFSDYTYDGSDVDDYGDSWYYYTAKSGYYVDMAYYQTEDGEYVSDIYVYFIYEGSQGGDGGNGGNGGSGGDGGNGGNDGNDDAGGSTTPDGLITNEGAGLPTEGDGVYDVDFTDGRYVKDVTDQGYYLDGCPTVGSPKVLVIPIDFSDINGRNNGYSIDNIVKIFSGGEGDVDYYSVHDYYYISSYGKLDIDVTVIDEWFVPKYSSSYYESLTMDYYGDQVAIGDQAVMDEALAYLDGFMDLSQFDSDGNAIIDAVVLVTTLEIDEATDFNWAYRYWNIYTDEDGYYYEYDGVSANDYLWASYSFMHESYDEAGEVSYTDTSVMNSYTFIHEFGHILGADDYYNTAERGEHPMDGCDVMDAMAGDHNPFTKFNLGWLTTSRLVCTDRSVTLTLDAVAKGGDTIILASNWDSTLGAYQEYYIICYYTAEGLNGGEYGYFARDGVIVYHINASLYSEEQDGEIFYDIYNNNTDPSDNYGTEDNLIEFVKSGEGNFTYVVGDSLPAITTDRGNPLPFTFVIDEMNGDSVTITFTRI